MNGREKIGVYVHIPFCTKKCDYCHFYVIPEKESWKERLTDCLLAHWNEWQQKKPCKIRTLYFGGGTPALMGKRLPKLTEAFLPLMDEGAEITLEANPENLTDEDLQIFKAAGFNRLSLGVQTLDETLLPILGRTHTATTAARAVERAAKFFDNISIDLMYDLPNQSLGSWKKTLDSAALLPITHLSLYNLTIEPHTSFYKRRHQLSLPAPSISAEMYEVAVETLEKHGLKQYEISAFSREGFQAQHNLGYWQGVPFLGLGPSAYSYLDGSRFRCHAHFNRYCSAIEEGLSPLDFEEKLDVDAAAREQLVIALRVLEGVKIEEMATLTEDTQNEIKKLMEQGLLLIEKDHLKMTQQGIRFYDTIAEMLI